MKLRNLLFIIGFILVATLSAHSADKKHVLVVNSYHKGLKWSDDIVQGINDGLKKSAFDIEVYTEFIDSKRFLDTKVYHECLYNLFQTKYKNIKLDVIIVSDDNALTFILEHRDSVFGKVPTVFCGINNPHNYPESYTGVLENIEYVDNFKLIKDLHPDYSKIYFIVDNTTTGKIIFDRAHRLGLSTHHDFRYEFLRDYTFNELYSRVSELDENAVVFLTVFTKDRNGMYCSYNELILNLMKSTKVPVYGAWDFYLDRGIVGGKLIKGFEQGFLAAKMANRILNGEKIQQIDIEISRAEYIFDYHALKKYQIARRRLPERSKVINRPFGFIFENRQQTLFWGIIFILLVTAIIILLTYIIYRKKKIIEIRRYNKSIELNNEKLQLAKQKAEESDRLKSAFLATMSHELRTPMNGIIGFSKLIIDSNNLSPEIQKKYLNIIHKSGYILLNLVNDIIDLSKIEAMQLKLNYTSFDLNELIEELRSFFISEKDSVGKNELEIIAEKDNSLEKLIIYSDSNRVRQVLYNLLQNALKFTEKGYIKFGYSIENEDILFFVKDSGIGMADLDKEIIFERFRQVDDKTTRRYGGSGIGLTVSKGIVENLKGKIWVESKKGSGSSFYFTVPYNPVSIVKKEVNTKVDYTDFSWPGKTILIVEDSQVSCELLTKFLKDAKVNFLHATDGEQAVEMCKNNGHIDIVLMDIQLPIMDGLEATAIIKELNPKLPIIAQTANAMEEDKPNIISAGCDDYLSKPINRMELLQKINTLLVE